MTLNTQKLVNNRYKYHKVYLSQYRDSTYNCRSIYSTTMHRNLQMSPFKEVSD